MKSAFDYKKIIMAKQQSTFIEISWFGALMYHIVIGKETIQPHVYVTFKLIKNYNVSIIGFKTKTNSYVKACSIRMLDYVVDKLVGNILYTFAWLNFATFQMHDKVRIFKRLDYRF